MQKVTEMLGEHHASENVTMAEAAYRWLLHHSALDGAKGDRIVIGSSRTEQLEINLNYMRKETDFYYKMKKIFHFVISGIWIWRIFNYSWVCLEAQFLKTDCPYKPTFSKKKLSLAKNSKLSL